MCLDEQELSGSASCKFQKCRTLMRNLMSENGEMFRFILFSLLLLNSYPWMFVVDAANLAPSRSSGVNDNSETTFDTDCIPEDCSQAKRAFLENDHKFICQIGLQKACDSAEAMIEDDWLDPENVNYAKLSAIHLYPRMNRKFQPDPYRALNFTMTLPHADAGAFKATMIYVTFSSPAGLQQDFFYHNNPRCRLFNFSKTKLNEVDLKQPREIFYPCFVGLDETTTKHYYILNFTVLPYQAFLTYHITTHYPESNPDDLSVTTAIAILKFVNKVHLVYDLFPHPVSYYQLKLYKNSHLEENKNVAPTVTEYEFDIRDTSEYHIGIVPVFNNKMYKETLTKSVHFTAKIAKEDVPTNMGALIAVLCGLFIAIIIFVIICIKRSTFKAKRSSQTLNNVGFQPHRDDDNNDDDDDDYIHKISYRNIKF